MHVQNRDWTSKLSFHNEAEGRQWEMSRYNRVTSEMIKPVIHWDLRDGTHPRYLCDQRNLRQWPLEFYQRRRMVFRPICSQQLLHPFGSVFRNPRVDQQRNKSNRVTTQRSGQKTGAFHPRSPRTTSGSIRTLSPEQEATPVTQLPVPYRAAVHLSRRGLDRASPSARRTP